MRWGVLGCANIAKTSVIPAIQEVEGNQLIAVASRDLKKATEFSKLFNCKAILGYDTLLASTDIDVVYIPLPTGMHHEWVINALNCGKHVLVEKSAVSSLAEAKEIIALARTKNLAIVENFQFQYHSQHRYVKDIMENEELGEIRCFRSSFGFPPFSIDTNIRYNRKLGGGALLDAGAYVLRATSFMLGEGFEVASSFLRMNPKFNVDWFGGAFLVNKSKGIFSEVAFGFDNFYQCNYEIWGSKGKITSTRAFTAKSGFKPTILLEKHGFKEEIVLPEDNHFRNMIKHFNQVVKSNKYEVEWENILSQSKLIDQVFSKNGNLS